MDKIKIPTFEGYDKGPRWEVSNGQAVAFEDGATFGYVNYELSLGWYARTLCTAEDGEDEVECYFATAEDAIIYVNQVYLALQARIAEYWTSWSWSWSLLSCPILTKAARSNGQYESH